MSIDPDVESHAVNPQAEELIEELIDDILVKTVIVKTLVEDVLEAVSYTHLTLPTNREV